MTFVFQGKIKFYLNKTFLRLFWKTKFSPINHAILLKTLP